jgi:hypothetical protein
MEEEEKGRRQNEKKKNEKNEKRYGGSRDVPDTERIKQSRITDVKIETLMAINSNSKRKLIG